jgi:hypothetical protein
MLADIYITQNYWFSGLYPSSGILNTIKHIVSETGFKRCVFWYLELRTMDKVQKPSNSQCYKIHHFGNWAQTICFLVFRIQEDGQSPDTQ